jgi:sarcosine oxidase subunit beta
VASGYDVIVLGAGIFGASCAYHAKKSGVPRVLLLDKGPSAASGTTGASAAIIRQHYSNRVLSEATHESIDILRELGRQQGTGDLFHPSGWHFLVPQDSLGAAQENVEMQHRSGIRADLTLAGDLQAELAWLNPDGVAAVVHEPDSGYADPVRCAEAFVSQFERLGGLAKFHTPCEALIRKGDRIEGVRTHEGPISAGWVVNACGPWSKSLAATADITLPVKIFREQETVWQCRHAAHMPAGSISNAVDAIYLRPMGQGRYTVGRGYPKQYYEADADNYDHGADDEVVNDILERVQKRFLPFAGANYLDGFSSLYDVTPDWYPFLGPRSDVSGYADASGGSGHGFKLAPALGARLVDWLWKGQVSQEIRRLSFDRVSRNELFIQKFGGNRG